MRNPNGYGSVYKLSGKRRKPWAAAITTGYGEPVKDEKTGRLKEKRLYKIIGYFADKTAAIKALADHHDTPCPKRNFTLEMIYDEWKVLNYPSESGKPGISAKTEEGYRIAWKRCDKIKAVEVREIKTSDLQKVIDNNKGKDGNQLSYSSCNNIRCLMTQLWDYAMQEDIVNKNYAKFLVLPEKQKSKKDRFTDIELKLIEKAAADGMPFADCILMLCYTGFRINEFLDLTLFSYDNKNDTLTGGKKSVAGKDRVIPVHPKIKPYLEAWLAKGGERIICKDNGKPFGDRSFRDDYYFPTLRSIKGVRALYPHECRHTFGSLIDKVNASDKVKEELMGHEKYETTKAIYVHKMLDELRNAIDQIP